MFVLTLVTMYRGDHIAMVSQEHTSEQLANEAGERFKKTLEGTARVFYTVSPK